MRIKTERDPRETDVYLVSELPEGWIKFCFHKGRFKDVRRKNLKSLGEVEKALARFGEVSFSPGNIIHRLMEMR